MQLLRLILNNGFFILVLAAAAILSLAYSTREPESNEMISPLPITDAKTIKNNVTGSDQTNELETPQAKQEENDSNLNNLPLNEPTSNTSKADVVKNNDQSPLKSSISSTITENKNIGVKTDSSSENEKATRSNREMIESTLIRYNSFQQAWQAARFAFYNSNLSQAEQIYDALAIISQNPDVLGEYGNLMWRLNQPKKAAQLWQASANKWILNNQPQRASYLAHRLVKFSPQTTEWIRKRLNQRPMDNVMSLLPEPAVHSLFTGSHPSNTVN